MHQRHRYGFAFPGWWTSGQGWDASTGGFPWGRWGRFFAPGEIRLALLFLLQDGPKHGYELIKELETRSGGFYRASAGTIYPTLQQLEDEDLVASEQREGKRVYRLTDKGREELQRDPEAVRRIFRRVDSCGDWSTWAGSDTAAVLGAVGELMRSMWRVARDTHADPENMDRVRTILERARRDIDHLADRQGEPRPPSDSPR